MSHECFLFMRISGFYKNNIIYFCKKIIFLINILFLVLNFEFILF
ncbi:hypothetical protein HMPREF1584_00830 [Gardnerella vaginalis JCP8481A]|nr:hypothetical protein HMPREF1585_00931 [Gardnerella vaginalis JCP8481B]EPI42734.1 hypothetical protein HMPREF1584_00830 [Gardnerella vaginalis JCP8481A]